jgi:hypothetical protein
MVGPIGAAVSLECVTDWPAIEPQFVRLRDFVLADLEGFGENERGGNFGLVALVLTACDALGTLRYASRGSGSKVFELCLPEPWKPVADILYDALRHGLIHGYDAKLIDDGTTKVAFAIGWHRKHSDRHMRFVEPGRLYIQAQTLVDGLRDAFAHIENELRADARLRDTFLVQANRDRVVHVTEHDAERWRTAVRNAEAAQGKIDVRGVPTLTTTSPPTLLTGATGSPGPSPSEDQGKP